MNLCLQSFILASVGCYHVPVSFILCLGAVLGYVQISRMCVLYVIFSAFVKYQIYKNSGIDGSW